MTITKTRIDTIIQDFIKKYPDHGNLTIAKAIYAKHPSLFGDVEKCRYAVRYRRGATGDDGRKKQKMTSIMTPTRTPVPKSMAKVRKPYDLPQGRTAILSDIHIPYHDLTSLNAALDYLDEFKPDNILLNGDTIDFYAISRWEKDPEIRNFAAELEKTRQLLAHLRDRFPDARIIWKNGNHEERWEKYLWNKAPELCGVPDFELKVLLRFEQYGVEFVHGRQTIKAGKYMTILHGHEIPGAFDPVNFARTLCQKLKVCAMAGHKHKVSEHTEKTADDKYISCWSTGCFEEMHPDYMPINNWCHGFATLILTGNEFAVNNLRIIDGKVK